MFETARAAELVRSKREKNAVNKIKTLAEDHFLQGSLLIALRLFPGLLGQING